MADDGSAWVSQPRAHTAVPSALQWPARGPAWGSAVHHPALRRACVFASVLVVASVLLVTIGQPRDSDSFHAPIPIDIECPAFSGGAVKVTMCHLDRATYASDPSAYPMFRDQTASLCDGTFYTTLKELRLRLDGLPVDAKQSSRLVGMPRQPPARPAGMIFHMTRCGSTLVANMFGSVLSNMVLTESRPPATLLQCPTLTDADKVAGLRTLLRAMGAPTRGRNVVIKFQSAMLRHNHLIRRAFPSTPWVFLFRAPGEVMASLLFKNGARPSHSAPCLRSQRWPPVGIQQVLGMDAHQASRAAPTQYCAAHLALLMHYGVDGLNASLAPAVAVEYPSLPGSVFDVVAPLFGIDVSADDRSHMEAAGSTYSKSRSPITGGRTFVSDSQKKAQVAARTHATEYAAMYTADLFEALKSFTTVHVGLPRVGQTDDTSDYPEHATNLGHLLDAWPLDEVQLPDFAAKYDSLARFRYRNPAARVQALQFRRAELPFVVGDIPSLTLASETWTREYLEARLARTYPVSVRNDNMFMQHSGATQKPSDRVHISFATWAASSVEHRHWHVPGNRLSDCNATPPAGDNGAPYMYLRASTQSSDAAFLFDDLSFFRSDDLLFGVPLQPQQRHNAIECRFAPAGLSEVAVGRSFNTFVAVVRGAVRFVLVPPAQCTQLRMYSRPTKAGITHSKVNWAARKSPCPGVVHDDDGAQHRTRGDRGFDSASAINVVVKAGQALFIPAFWVHTLVALTDASHCRINAGSSSSEPSESPFLSDCGFATSRLTPPVSPEATRITLRAKYRDEFADFNGDTPAALYGQGLAEAYASVSEAPLGAPASEMHTDDDAGLYGDLFSWPSLGAGLIRSEDLQYLRVNASSFAPRVGRGRVPKWAGSTGVSTSPWASLRRPSRLLRYTWGSRVVVFFAVPATCVLLAMWMWSRSPRRPRVRLPTCRSLCGMVWEEVCGWCSQPYRSYHAVATSPPPHRG